MSQDQPPTSPEPNSYEQLLHESMQSYLLKGAEEIRQKLKLNEDSFRFMSRAHNERGRSHFIYEVLNEVEQLAMVLDIFNERLKELPKNPIGDDIEKRIFRNSFELTEREYSLHLRRLTELLVFLINFSQTNSDEYYDHFLLYQELDQRKKKREDFKVFYGCENLNNKTVIDALMRSIAWGEERVDVNKCWYLSGHTPKSQGKAKRSLRVSKNVSKKLSLLRRHPNE